MKLTKKQKTIIWKSLKLNEDFFDKLDKNELSDDSVDDAVDKPVDNSNYTYHILFIINMYPFFKINNGNECFENPKYKSFIESGLLSMKNALKYILQVSPIVTDYSEPKFCSSSKKIITAFLFMDNRQSDEFGIGFSNFIITLETSINLSKRKNTRNIIRLFCSFWRLQQIYNKILTSKLLNINTRSKFHINIGLYRTNPYKREDICPLMQSDKELTLYGMKLINFLNDKDETD